MGADKVCLELYYQKSPIRVQVSQAKRWMYQKQQTQNETNIQILRSVYQYNRNYQYFANHNKTAYDIINHAKRFEVEK